MRDSVKPPSHALSCGSQVLCRGCLHVWAFVSNGHQLRWVSKNTSSGKKKNAREITWVLWHWNFFYGYNIQGKQWQSDLDIMVCVLYIQCITQPPPFNSALKLLLKSVWNHHAWLQRQATTPSIVLLHESHKDEWAVRKRGRPNSRLLINATESIVQSVRHTNRISISATEWILW